jgi:hypothetical protein
MAEQAVNVVGLTKFDRFDRKITILYDNLRLGSGVVYEYKSINSFFLLEVFEVFEPVIKDTPDPSSDSSDAVAHHVGICASREQMPDIADGQR